MARSTDQLASVTEEIRAAGGTAAYARADLAEPPSVRAAVDVAVQRFGRMDVAFNNAGTGQPPRPLDQVPDGELDEIDRVNLKGTWVAVAAEVAAIRATAGRGAIVNNSSVGSLSANSPLPAYGAMKRAVNSLSESAAATYGPEGIRVNAIAPGTTLTEMIEEWDRRHPGIVEQLNARTPLDRAAEPAEIAEAAAWLLSDRASYVTGVVLPVIGGSHL